MDQVDGIRGGDCRADRYADWLHVHRLDSGGGGDGAGWRRGIHGTVEDQSVYGNVQRERRRGRQDGDTELRHCAGRADGDADRVHLCRMVAGGSVDDAGC